MKNTQSAHTAIYNLIAYTLNIMETIMVKYNLKFQKKRLYNSEQYTCIVCVAPVQTNSCHTVCITICKVNLYLFLIVYNFIFLSSFFFANCIKDIDVFLKNHSSPTWVPTVVTVWRSQDDHIYWSILQRLCKSI